MISVGILNVSGYIGAETARILRRHPNVRVTSVTGRSAAGKPLAETFPHLAAYDLDVVEDVGDVDIVISALPHAAGAPALLPLIDKGVPMSAGMGGSAASAVAGAAAVNALLPTPFAHADLLPFAMAGERVSSDPPPWDNVAASLFGGLVIVASERDALVRPLPTPSGIVSTRATTSWR